MMVELQQDHKKVKNLTQMTRLALYAQYSDNFMFLKNCGPWRLSTPV